MILSDFMTLMGFVQSTFVSIWSCLDHVVIVSNGTATLTLLGFFLGVAFIMIVLQMLKRIRES